MIGGECNTHGREELRGGFRCGNMREKDHVEDSAIDGRFILREIFGKLNKGLE